MTAFGVARMIAEAVRASGVIVCVEPVDFQKVLRRHQAALIVHATGGWFSVNHQYLTSYKGLAFSTKSPVPLDLPADAEVVEAQTIWTPA